MLAKKKIPTQCKPKTFIKNYNQTPLVINSPICFQCVHFSDNFNNGREKCKRCVKTELDSYEGLRLIYQEFEFDSSFGYSQIIKPDGNEVS